MAANGIPGELFEEIFKQTVITIRGLADRVKAGTYGEEDIRLLSVCSDVCFASRDPVSSELMMSSLWSMSSRPALTRTP
jgi:hypothetical protein